LRSDEISTIVAWNVLLLEMVAEVGRVVVVGKCHTTMMCSPEIGSWSITLLVLAAEGDDDESLVMLVVRVEAGRLSCYISRNNVVAKLSNNVEMNVAVGTVDPERQSQTTRRTMSVHMKNLGGTIRELKTTYVRFV
jgi:hypothetical protein